MSVSSRLYFSFSFSSPSSSISLSVESVSLFFPPFPFFIKSHVFFPSFDDSSALFSCPCEPLLPSVLLCCVCVPISALQAPSRCGGASNVERTLVIQTLHSAGEQIVYRAS